MKKNIVSRRSLAVLVLSLIGFMLPATVASSKPAPPPSGPKLYSIAVDVDGSAGTLSTFTVTITNLPQSSAVLGSANITIPSSFGTVTFVGTGVPVASAGKTWSASKSGTTLIKLRAVGDMQKLSPGQYVRIVFTATPPANAGASSVSYTFGFAAKASRDFSGSSTFTRLGSDPVLLVCPTAANCSGTFGDESNAPAGQQTGTVTTDEPCDGCILVITGTPGNFCLDGESLTNCRSQGVIRFNIVPGYPGSLTIFLTCDVNDCPEPPPCDCTSATALDFYPAYYTQSDSNGSEGTDVKTLDDCYFTDGPPCIDNQYRLYGEGGGSNDLQSEISLSLSDPRIGY